MIKSQKILVGITAFLALLFAGNSDALAAQLQSINITPSTPLAATSNTHTFNFTIPTAHTVEQIKLEYCDAPSPAASCTQPTGLLTTSASKGTFTSMGAGGAAEWSIYDDVAPVIEIGHVGGGNAFGGNAVVTFEIDGITNHSISHDCDGDANISSDTCYVRIYTCTPAQEASCGTGTTFTDSGIGSYTIVAGVTVTARVDPIFSFIIQSVASGQTNNGITTSVASTYNTLPFSNLTANTPKYAAHALGVTTNADGGYTVTMQLQNQMTGVYAANNIDPHPGTWGTPRVWTQPTGTTPNTDTAWIGANTTDTDVSGWTSGDSPSGKFGPVTSASAGTVMQGSQPEDGTNAVYVTYGIEANVFQPGDTYQGTLLYSALPTY